jgi:hypothetical protein
MNLSQDQIEHLVALVRKRFLDWNGFDHPGFQGEEIDYKQAAAEKAATLLSQDELRRLLDENDVDEIISRLDTVGQATNLLWLRAPTTGDLGILYQDDLDKPAFCQQVVDLLYGLYPSWPAHSAPSSGVAYRARRSARRSGTPSAGSRGRSRCDVIQRKTA